MTQRPQFSYQRRFITTTIIIFGIFTILAGALQYQREKKYQSDRIKEQLSTYAQTVSNFIDVVGIDSTKLEPLVRLLPDTTVRISVINKEGKVLYDSEIVNIASLANHSDRPEIIAAKNSGTGDDIRESVSTGKPYYYHAKRADQYYVRCAIPYNISIASILETNQTLIFYYVVFFLIVLLLIVYLSHLYSRIQDSNKQLTDEKEKIYQHLRITNEGVAIFSSDKKVIISNDYFFQYIDNISSPQLADLNRIFNIREFEPVEKFIDDNAKIGKKSDDFRSRSFNVNKNNKTFVINVIIFNDNSFEISINDITVSIEQEELKRQLTQNIAHELKTPVSSIQGFMETIINNPSLPADKQRFFVERSYSQAIRLSNLVSDIALLNKIEGTVDSLKQEPVPMSQLFQSIIDDVYLQIEEKSVSVSNTLPDNITVRGDRSLIYSALRNLVDNSLLYAGTHFNISINCYREDETHYYFSYYDTGSGIDEVHLTRIFDRFYRVDEGRSRKMGGTGLGLAIVKNAVTIHKGTIVAKRHQGGGLEFVFSLSK